MPSPRHARRSSLRSARRRAALAGACTVALAGMLLTAPPSVAADGTADGLGGLAQTVVPVGAATRHEALAAYDAVQDAIDVPAGWSGSVDGCRVGTESPDSTAATLASLNALRSVVDAAPVRLDADLNRKALAAALIMKAQGALSHDPPSDWRCWSAEGREAAGSSNLFLGYSGAQAMEGFVDDAGIDSLGHRRWLLDPRSRVFGTGSTGSSNALWVFGPDDVAVPDRTAVAWPPAGHLAEPWLFQDWSLEIVEADLTGLDAAQVSVTVDGRAAEVTRLRPLAQYFGPGTGLAWRVPTAADLPAGDHEVVVRVSGIRVDGDSSPITWRTTVVDPDGAVPPPDPDPVVQPPAFADRPVVRKAQGSTGQVRPGTRLVARWNVVRSDGETVAWTRDGRTLRGAVGRSYVVRRADRGHALRAVVTATGEGGTTTRRSLALRVR